MERERDEWSGKRMRADQFAECEAFDCANMARMTALMAAEAFAIITGTINDGSTEAVNAR